MANNFVTSTQFTYQTETLTQQARVNLSGGTIERIHDLDIAIINQKQINDLQNLVFGVSPSYGYRVSSGVFDVLYDYSGNNNDTSGTTTARPTYSANTRFGKSTISFDGVNDVLTTPPISLSATNAMTITCWINCTSAGGATIVFFNQLGTAINNGNFRVGRLTGTNTLFFGYGTGAASTTSTYTNFWGSDGSLDNTWIHLAIVVDYSANTLKAYRNGLKYGATNALTTPVPPTALSAIGIGSMAAGGNTVTGSMDDIRLYSVALSDNDIQRIVVEV